MSVAQPEHQRAAATRPWSMRMADSVIARHTPARAEWHYEHGLVLLAILQVWRATGEHRYWEHVKQTADLFIAPDGSIRTYSMTDYNLDQINYGKLLFPLYQATGEPRYAHAIETLRMQLAGQPRTESGGFWHKQIYPFQMWLDGLYMAAPFYAQYANVYGEVAAFDDIAQQFTLSEQHARDVQTGLLYHAWDESKRQLWANPETGCSPHFWGRAIGWYMMALVDVLDFFPSAHPRRADLLAILGRLAEALARVQDAPSGLWFQVLDQGARAGNYLEASASCMYVYALAKAVRLGYLAPSYAAIAARGYDGILQRLISVDAQGLVTLSHVCAVAGLGGNPYRDGSYEYYVGELVRANDYKGVGPFILAALEFERGGAAAAGDAAL